MKRLGRGHASAKFYSSGKFGGDRVDKFDGLKPSSNDEAEVSVGIHVPYSTDPANEAYTARVPALLQLPFLPTKYTTGTYNTSGAFRPHVHSAYGLPVTVLHAFGHAHPNNYKKICALETSFRRSSFRRRFLAFTPTVVEGKKMIASSCDVAFVLPVQIRITSTFESFCVTDCDPLLEPAVRNVPGIDTF